MAAPTELSLDAVRNFMIEKGGKVTNHELVKHFKKFLTNPDSRVEARTIFKEYVNTLASIKNEEGEKYVVLKRKFRPYELLNSASLGSPTSSVSSENAGPPYTPSVSSASSPCLPLEILDLTSPARQPPPYRPPPPPTSPSRPSPPPIHRMASIPSELSTLPEDSVVSLAQTLSESSESVKAIANSDEKNEVSNKLPEETDPPPPVPPRRRSSDRGRSENKENQPDTSRKLIQEEHSEEKKPERPLSEIEAEQKISVKERMQKFNRLASESDLLLLQPNAARKKFNDKGADDDDRVSVTSLNPKTREWLVRAAQGNYHDLAKLASEDSRLPKVKDPTTGYTALHWAAKNGNEDIVKLIAGAYGVSPNVRSHGGYTPLHIATQFGHENVFNLLVKVYGGNPQLRDWSGRMPRQYIVSQDTSVSAETFRKMKARKKHSEKELGFLRIGSLNVRVKKTTEAFSNFLGVGSQSNSSGSNYGGSSTNSGEKIHKSWGSADNIQEVDRRMMPPPKNPSKKRRSKMAQQLHHHRSQQELVHLNTVPSRATVSHSALPDSVSASTPASPTLRRASNPDTITEELKAQPSLAKDIGEGVVLRHGIGNGGDSDSDTACGFGSNWKSTV